MTKKKYPTLLSNIPEGKDLFKSKSHQNISKTIAVLIQSQGDIIKKQIIGLEGDWGTGKSNIVKILETELNDTYYHFNYDTWTHQEDLTRKSILQELIFFLKSENVKIIDSQNNGWKQKENELSQKILSKNTEVFPKIKAYYILIITAFIIIKFGNEISKQIIEGRIFGFYDNSFIYLIDNFFLKLGNPFKLEYLLKLFPFLLIVGGFCHFIYSFYKEFNLNKEKPLDKKISISQLLGKQFYWISGEKLESFSNEKINEKEPSNQMFRSFLKDIDDELKSKSKKLIFTIDNTDRLSGSKLKNIWSTINIFFAESSNVAFLQNIWLIIPYDEKRIILSMEDEGARGLLEKTFAITFKVTPPLLSNWESFFDECFDTAFKEIEINGKKEEIQLLKRIFESHESNITPRKIINFINQISTYYIQNSTIKLRYNAIFELMKTTLLEGNINENIIDRKKYLGNLDLIFIADDQLEINISKIVYGISNEEEAQEALLVNSIENILNGKMELNESILKIPCFNVYFNIVFKKFVDKNSDKTHNWMMLQSLTKILIQLNETYIEGDNSQIYKSLWQKYSILILKNDLNVFDDTYKNVIQNCERSTVINLVNNAINSITLKTDFSRIDRDKEYITFLEDLDNYIETTNYYKIEDFNIKKYNLRPEGLISYLINNPNLVNKYKFFVKEEELKTYFNVSNRGFRPEIALEHKVELFELCKNYDLEFLINEINSYWITNEFKSFDSVNILMQLYKKLNNRNAININKLSTVAYVSLVKLIKNNLDKTELLENAYLLFLINYNNTIIVELDNDVINILSSNNVDFLKKMKEEMSYFPFKQNFIKLLRMAVEIENPNLNVLKKLFESILDFDMDPDDDTFNWILKEYSRLRKYVFENKDILYDFIEKYSFDKDINISIIDISLIGLKENIFNENLVIIANEYLRKNITNHPKLLQNKNLQEYKLLFKLLDSGLLHEDILSSLYIPLKNAILSNTLVDDFRFKNIIKIKKNLNEDDLERLVEDVLASSLRKGIIYLIPEVLYKFNLLSDLQRNTISNQISLEKSYYTNELIDFLLKNNNEDLAKRVKENILRIPESDIFQYAKKSFFM